MPNGRSSNRSSRPAIVPVARAPTTVAPSMLSSTSCAPAAFGAGALWAVCRRSMATIPPLIADCSAGSRRAFGSTSIAPCSGCFERMKRIDWSSGLLEARSSRPKRGRSCRPDRQGKGEPQFLFNGAHDRPRSSAPRLASDGTTAIAPATTRRTYSAYAGMRRVSAADSTAPSVNPAPCRRASRFSGPPIPNGTAIGELPNRSITTRSSASSIGLVGRGTVQKSSPCRWGRARGASPALRRACQGRTALPAGR
jgi:hypothetical protein